MTPQIFHPNGFGEKWEPCSSSSGQLISCNWVFGERMTASAFWHFLHIFFIAVTSFSATCFRVAFLPFVNAFRWPQLELFFEVLCRLKDTGDLQRNLWRAGWAAGGPGGCKAASKYETHKITSPFSTAWAISGTLLPHSTTVAHLTRVRCQDWSAVPWAGQRTLCCKGVRVFDWGPARRRILLCCWLSSFGLVCCLNNLAPSLLYDAAPWSIGYCKIQCLRGLIIRSFSLDATRCS